MGTLPEPTPARDDTRDPFPNDPHCRVIGDILCDVLDGLDRRIRKRLASDAAEAIETRELDR